MNPLSRLFRKAPPAPATLPERIATLQSAPGDVIADAALDSDDASLRVGAIRLLPDGEILRRLGGLADPPQGVEARTPMAVRHAAQQRLAQLIDDGSIDFAAFCSDHEHWSDRMTVAALCKDPDRLNHALARIDDPALLASLVVDSPSSRVRQSAAAAIIDPAQLHELLPRLRGKDKTAYKLIRQKCDVLLAEQRKAEQSARETTAFCESLEQHGEKPHDPHYAATFERLTAQWSALPTRPDSQLEQRVQQALERCREVIAAHEHEVARQAAERAAALEAEREAREARERALEAERRAAAEQAEAEARAQAAATAAREAEERARAEQEAAEAQAHREIVSLVRLSSAALQRGDSRKAARFRQAVEESLPAARELPPHLARSLQQLDERLNELRQWKDYVVAPKRIELIEEMEALVGSQEDPAELAEHVRALQQEWRTINKGIASDASAEGERFQQAFQAAFKPCQEYFASQAVIRRENLAARRQVLERLQAFVASQEADDADRRLLVRVLREAPQEWRSHSPVDREANRSVEIDFHRSMDRLRKILNAWYEGNTAEKRSLIARVHQLSTAEDTGEAIEGVKHLQSLWKETGPVSHEQSQALWDEFRALCDTVYKRRAEAYAHHSAGLQAAKAGAVALCEAVEQAGGVPAAGRASVNAKVREWQAAFDELGELPRADARGLRDRFERAISRYEAALADQELRDTEAAESNLFEAGRHIRAYERAVLQDAPPAERETLRNAAEAFIAGVRRWPGGGPQALKQALARADSASDPDDAAREHALRMLCIRAEIRASTPTPPEDEALRRDYQLRLLVEAMGQGTRVDDHDWDAMLAEWIGIGAVAPQTHEELERRFVRCLAQRPAKARHDASGRPRAGARR